ncbi:MAG: AraC family transcriptional regulator [Clostridia bacterium]|nr:AraC family transcriptional regulator [Clostridia bacterium]
MHSGIISASYSEALSGRSNHYHDGHQLLYIVKGEAEVSVGGRIEQIGAGTLLLFNRFEEHSITVRSEEYKRYSVRVSSEHGGAGERELLFALLVNRFPGFSHVLPSGTNASVLEGLFRRLVREYRAPAPFREEMLDALLRELLITVCRLMPQDAIPESSESAKLIYRIQQHFEREYREEFSLASLAEEYHMSASYLSHLFKATTGVSVMEYLAACRMQAAKKYLATTDMTVGEIVSACGFSDSSNFSRSFKQRTGQTPSQFRKRYLRD